MIIKLNHIRAPVSQIGASTRTQPQYISHISSKMKPNGIYRCGLACAILATGASAAQITTDLTKSSFLLPDHRHNNLANRLVEQMQRSFLSGPCTSMTTGGMILTSTFGTQIMALGQHDSRPGILQAFSTVIRDMTWSTPKQPLRICIEAFSPNQLTLDRAN